jgi:hypothetical protein
MSAAAAALGPILSKETAKRLAEFSVNMKATAESSLGETMETMRRFGVAMEPLMAPLQLITAKIEAGTIDSVIKNMETMFKMLENPSVQRILDAVIYILNLIINGSTTIMNVFDMFSRILNDFKDSHDSLEEIWASLTKIWDALVGSRPNQGGR